MALGDICRFEQRQNGIRSFTQQEYLCKVETPELLLVGDTHEVMALLNDNIDYSDSSIMIYRIIKKFRKYMDVYVSVSQELIQQEDINEDDTVLKEYTGITIRIFGIHNGLSSEEYYSIFQNLRDSYLIEESVHLCDELKVSSGTFTVAADDNAMKFDCSYTDSIGYYVTYHGDIAFQVTLFPNEFITFDDVKVGLDAIFKPAF